MVKERIDKNMISSNLQYTIKEVSDNFIVVIKFSKENLKSTNIYFLDVFLNSKYNGLTLGKEIRKYDYNGYIIFITWHLEFSLKVFQYKLKVLDYIFKGDSDINERITECLNVIKKECRRDMINNQEERYFIIKNRKDIYSIPFTDILYFETNTHNRKITLHTINRNLEYNGTLLETMDKLDDSFYRCHRSYIINLKHIKLISTKKNDRHVIVGDNQKCLLSQKYLKGLINRINNEK